MSSKYDLIKVKVMVTDEDYYVLSRYTLSKMLAFCNIPEKTAVKLALKLKKKLVNDGTVKITQQYFLNTLFDTMVKDGFGSYNIALFRVMMRVHSERLPVVLIVGGTWCSGKSCISQQLGSRLGSNYVVQTDTLMEVHRAVTSFCQSRLFCGCPEDQAKGTVSQEGGIQLANSSTLQLNGINNTSSSNHTDASVTVNAYNNNNSKLTNIWDLDPYCPDEDVISVWKWQCKCVADIIESDIHRALREGKILILEGILIDFRLYSKYFFPHINDCCSSNDCGAYGIDRSTESIANYTPPSTIPKRGVCLGTWVRPHHIRDHMSDSKRYFDIEMWLTSHPNVFTSLKKNHSRRLSRVKHRIDIIEREIERSVHEACPPGYIVPGSVEDRKYWYKHETEAAGRAVVGGEGTDCSQSSDKPPPPAVEAVSVSDVTTDDTSSERDGSSTVLTPPCAARPSCSDCCSQNGSEYVLHNNNNAHVNNITDYPGEAVPLAAVGGDTHDCASPVSEHTKRRKRQELTPQHGKHISLLRAMCPFEDEHCITWTHHWILECIVQALEGV